MKVTFYRKCQCLFDNIITSIKHQTLNVHLYDITVNFIIPPPKCTATCRCFLYECWSLSIKRSKVLAIKAMRLIDTISKWFMANNHEHNSFFIGEYIYYYALINFPKEIFVLWLSWFTYTHNFDSYYIFIY